MTTSGMIKGINSILSHCNKPNKYKTKANMCSVCVDKLKVIKRSLKVYSSYNILGADKYRLNKLSKPKNNRLKFLEDAYDEESGTGCPEFAPGYVLRHFGPK